MNKASSVSLFDRTMQDYQTFVGKLENIKPRGDGLNVGKEAKAAYEEYDWEMQTSVLMQPEQFSKMWSQIPVTVRNPLNHEDQRYAEQMMLFGFRARALAHVVRLALAGSDGAERRVKLDRVKRSFELFQNDMRRSSFGDAWFDGFEHFLAYSLTDFVHDEQAYFDGWKAAADYCEKPNAPNEFFMVYAHYLAWHLRYVMERNRKDPKERLFNGLDYAQAVTLLTALLPWSTHENSAEDRVLTAVANLLSSDVPGFTTPAILLGVHEQNLPFRPLHQINLVFPSSSDIQDFLAELGRHGAGIARNIRASILLNPLLSGGYSPLQVPHDFPEIPIQAYMLKRRGKALPALKYSSSDDVGARSGPFRLSALFTPGVDPDWARLCFEINQTRASGNFISKEKTDAMIQSLLRALEGFDGLHRDAFSNHNGRRAA